MLTINQLQITDLVVHLSGQSVSFMYNLDGAIVGPETITKRELIDFIIDQELNLIEDWYRVPADQYLTTMGARYVVHLFLIERYKDGKVGA
jgi:hypothetical protein